MSVTLDVESVKRFGGDSDAVYSIYVDGKFAHSFPRDNWAIDKAEEILREGGNKKVVIIESKHTEPITERTYYKVTLDHDEKA